MDYQYIFERVESKYVISAQQYEDLLERCGSRIKPDVYPHSDITSIYFDTSDFLLARNSIEKPAFKEKLRLRSYGTVSKDSSVFLELKKKYKGVIYKRRQDMTYQQARNYILFNKMPCSTQIMQEIDYIRSSRYSLEPACLINYQRDSFTGINDSDLRITFDYDIMFAIDGLCLTNRNLKPLTDQHMIIMEIKTLAAMPLWLTAILNEMNIYPYNYSKYGMVYRNHIAKGGVTCSNYSPQSLQTHLVLSTISSAH